jgi:hypothetical protein
MNMTKQTEVPTVKAPIKVHVRTADGLRHEAARRGMKTEGLAGDIIAAVVQHDLFAAVLDV